MAQRKVTVPSEVAPGDFVVCAVPAASWGAANIGERQIMSSSPGPGPNPRQAGHRSCRLRSLFVDPTGTGRTLRAVVRLIRVAALRDAVQEQRSPRDSRGEYQFR
jgi:hypothetical protein